MEGLRGKKLYAARAANRLTMKLARLRWFHRFSGNRSQTLSRCVYAEAACPQYPSARFSCSFSAALRGGARVRLCQNYFWPKFGTFFLPPSEKYPVIPEVFSMCHFTALNARWKLISVKHRPSRLTFQSVIAIL